MLVLVIWVKLYSQHCIIDWFRMEWLIATKEC